MVSKILRESRWSWKEKRGGGFPFPLRFLPFTSDGGGLGESLVKLGEGGRSA